MSFSLLPETELQSLWHEVNTTISRWWDDDVRTALEKDVRDPVKNAIWYSDEEHRKKEIRSTGNDDWTLLFLPKPYLSAAGSESAFPEMYCWDTYFINRGLMLHERADLIRNHLVNQLFLIEQYGMVLNGNRTFYRTRSQTPLLAVDIWSYYQSTREIDLLYVAYPLLKKEYLHYWNADHHRTPSGLATNRDLGDTELRPELAAEAEIHDFSPCFEGDVRNCNPVQTNCALVRYADTLALIADALGRHEDVTVWKTDARVRRDRINDLCWNDEKQFYFDYHYIRGEQLPYWSLSGYWPLWADVATEKQARGMVGNLARFEQPAGLAQTDQRYPSPHPEFEWVQFQYPAGWPPIHMIIVEALDRYGYTGEARRIAGKYLSVMMRTYSHTGKLWEKYNVVEGNLSFPKERYRVPPMHGWSSAAVVVLGDYLFTNK
jgi:alpha,alpha-trehalase